MTEKAEHTELPYIRKGGIVISAKHYDHVAVSAMNRETKGRMEANAKFIVRACNSHYKLLEACKEFVRFAELPNTVKRGDYIRYQMKAIDAAKEAIAKAEGG
jgi:hypothetical protein